MNAPYVDRAALRPDAISLDDKFTLERGRVFMTGTQALIRLPMLQRERDLKNGLNTAGFITGYRGSPLGSVDQTAVKAEKHLAAKHIKFLPGVNEDLAATSVWGTQQVNLFPGAQYDGVFSLWYGKGPGVDRCGDVFKHANMAGSSAHGGVLVVAGGDGGPRASTGSTIFASRFYAPVASLGSWAQIISITLVSGWTAAATATALISGTTMTVTAIGSGALAPGQVVTGPSMLNATIVSQLSGTTGSTGTYQLSNSQTVGSSAVSAYAISANSVTLNIDDEPVTAAANVLVVIN